jgi:type I restriction enzyme M protein
MPTFEDFQTHFFAIFTQPHFRGSDFLRYLERPAPRRGGDEASIVDLAIVSPLLNLLGFTAGEQVYNRNKKQGRPDFAPEETDYNVCFVVEDKSTALDLTLDVRDPESHLAQLSSYLRPLGLRAGWLTNGRRLTVWRCDDPEHPRCTLDLDIPTALREWQQGGADSLSSQTQQALRLLWEQFRKETFADWQRLEREIATELNDWERQALPVGANPANQETLVGAVKMLLQDLQADARRILDHHLERYADYAHRSDRLQDDDSETVGERLEKLRANVLTELRRFAPLVGLEEEEVAAIHDDLRELQRDPRSFLNTKELLAKTLATINVALERKFPGDRRAARPWSKYDNGLGTLGSALQAYGDTAFAWHQKRAILRHDNRDSIEVQENYTLWKSVVQETMLGGLDEEQRKNEFALQAAYVVLIRLLLLRVCEDKGILPHRFVSDGGLRRWQEDIERYFIFTNGNVNPYDTLLDMAYQNAQNIYAHFFTGRELFNWYRLNRLRFIRVLYQLGRFNFADVDADLIGTIYNTYVERPEKKQKGQYYTPPAIVRYILDEVGYTQGTAIIGPNKRLLDPACGSGTFLIEAARRLIAAYGQGGDTPRQLLDRIRDNLYGFDLNPFACYLAEVNLLIQVLDLVKLAIEGKNPPRLQRFHIYNVDALSPASGILYYARANTLMAEELDVVDHIKGRNEGYAPGFAWVVANPPYGAKLTEAYKKALHEWMPDVFYGKPDTYVFFFRLGLRLLGATGRLGFITPNTYLMGTNTATLREQLLAAGRIEQIVDLPQGIWKDANVDCALIFLAADADAAQRRAQQIQVFSMDVRDSLDKLTARDWQETLTQPQSAWMDDPRHEINIRWTPLLQQIEEACRISTNAESTTQIQRLGDVTDSSAGVDPYPTAAEGKANRYIKPRREVPPNETDWKPLLDSESYIGRYELRWAKHQPYLKYGRWLARSREPIYFDSPKLLVQDMQNRAMRRRLKAAFDKQGFYSRKNFNSIIGKDSTYDLKYILALFNSSLLNYWFTRKIDNVHVNPSYFRQLPIYPADAPTQAELVALVDKLLVQHAALNVLREQGYIIRMRRDGMRDIQVPYDVLLAQMQQQNPTFPVLTLFDARAVGLIRLPAECDPAAQISRVFTPDKYPHTVVLRTNQLWLEVDDSDLRRYLRSYLARPQWHAHSWEEICGRALLPETADSRAAFFSEEARIVGEITARLDAIAHADATLDLRVLDLYGIHDPADRQRILGSAPVTEDAELEDNASTPEAAEEETLASESSSSEEPEDEEA